MAPVAGDVPVNSFEIPARSSVTDILKYLKMFHNLQQKFYY